MQGLHHTAPYRAVPLSGHPHWSAMRQRASYVLPGSTPAGGAGAVNYNGLPRGGIPREAFIYHPCPQEPPRGGNGIHIMPGRWSCAREIPLLAYDSIRPRIYCQAPNIICPCIYLRTVIYSVPHSPINRTIRTLRTLRTMRLPSLPPPGASYRK